jgi:hypothetical protein
VAVRLSTSGDVETVGAAVEVAAGGGGALGDPAGGPAVHATATPRTPILAARVRTLIVPTLPGAPAMRPGGPAWTREGLPGRPPMKV